MELRQAGPGSQDVYEGERSLENHLRIGPFFNWILNIESEGHAAMVVIMSPSFLCMLFSNELMTKMVSGPLDVRQACTGRQDWQSEGAECVVRILGDGATVKVLVFNSPMGLLEALV